jgi:hypothetical protein
MKFLNNTKEKIDLHKILFWQDNQQSAIEKHEKINLEKQWRIAFVIMIALGLSLVGFEVYLFTQIDSNSIFTTVTHEEVEVETLNVSEIERTILHYQEKNKVFESLLSSDFRFNSTGIDTPDVSLDEVGTEDLATTTQEADIR